MQRLKSLSAPLIALAAVVAMPAMAEEAAPPRAPGFPKPDVIVINPPPASPPPAAPVAPAPAPARADARATTGPVTSYSALASDINYHSSMRSLTLPSNALGAVVSTPAGCVGNKLEHNSHLWNGFTNTQAKPVTEAICQFGVSVANMKAACQYKTAARMEQRMYELMDPGQSYAHLVSDAPENMSPVDCAALLRPRLVLDGRSPGVE